MTTASTTATTWTIDSTHSIAEFAVKHMVVSTVKGRFRTMAGTIRLDEGNPENSSVEATIDTASVDTGDPNRDTHLRSDDFFNAERFPRITFRSTGVKKTGDDEWKIEGDLTIRDVTKPVVLETEFEGQVKDAFGKQRAAFTSTTSVNRKEFGLNWNGVIEAGGVVVSDKVKITLHVAAVRQDPA
ncbi:MAG: YceI family protein [Dehalococcoidia bacterium]